MPIITLQLPEMMDPVTARVFRTVLAQLDGVLSREHNYDGTHSNVTARSINVESNPAFGDEDTSGGVYERGRLIPMGDWWPYVPIWTQDTTQPAIGNGGLIGSYTLVGRTCHFRAHLRLGTTTVVGTGVFMLSLPVPAMETSPARPRWAFPAWTVNFATSPIIYYGLFGYLQSATKISFGPFALATSALVSESVPAVWGANDELVVSGTYEIA